MNDSTAAELQDLESHVLALYQRLQDDALMDGDLLPEGDVEFADFQGAVDLVYQSREAFDDALGEFSKNYAPFSIFADGEMVIDVGADWGYSAIAMQFQGCTADILSLDAAPFHSKALSRLVELENGKYGWKSIAASNTSGDITFYTPVLDGQPITGLTSSGGTLVATAATIVTDYVKKYGKPLDQRKGQPYRFSLYRFSTRANSLDFMYLGGELGQRPISAIKMDIEGHEGKALTGAKMVLRDHKPLVMVESANRNPEVSAVMSSLGYFHCELHDGFLERKSEMSVALDGYWVHPDSAGRYQSCGLFKG